MEDTEDDEEGCRGVRNNFHTASTINESLSFSFSFFPPLPSSSLVFFSTGASLGGGGGAAAAVVSGRLPSPSLRFGTEEVMGWGRWSLP